MCVFTNLPSSLFPPKRGEREAKWLRLRIEMSVFTDISVLRLYGYIGEKFGGYFFTNIEWKLFKININAWKNFKKW